MNNQTLSPKHTTFGIRQRVGIVGGGQLARMLALASKRLHLETTVLANSADCPAAPFSTVLLGDSNELACLRKLASQCDAITLENEFVPADLLRQLEIEGFQVLPSSQCIEIVQDKFRQKNALRSAGLATPEFRAVSSPEDLISFGNEFGWPVVLKTCRNGYDGKGNATVRNARQAREAWSSMSARAGTALMVEAFCHFLKELAVMVVRSSDGSVVTYPVVETKQENHVCRWVVAPARVPQSIAQVASEIAVKAVETVSGIGCFGIEFFLTGDGRLLVNELAPRVHNSGHYTIEGCACSQFENHLRAIAGWPLGPVTMVSPAAAMVNLLGDSSGSVEEPDLRDLPQSVSVHWYGKRETSPGRKLGHITTLADSPASAIARALSAAEDIMPKTKTIQNRQVLRRTLSPAA